MKTKLAKAQKTLLIISGVLLIFISASIIVSPTDFYGSNNIELGTNTSLINELKTPAGLLLSAGVFMIVAVMIRGKLNLALALSALIYLSYAVSRFASMAVDGLPASGLLTATFVEAAIGLACLSVLIIGRTPARVRSDD
jgi:uncharacterized membrane protein